MPIAEMFVCFKRVPEFVAMVSHSLNTSVLYSSAQLEISFALSWAFFYVYWSHKKKAADHSYTALLWFSVVSQGGDSLHLTIGQFVTSWCQSVFVDQFVCAEL